MNKVKPRRFPIDIGFFDTMSLTPEDREFLKDRRDYFNYLVERVENNSQKLDEVLEFLNKNKVSQETILMANNGVKYKSDNKTRR